MGSAPISVDVYGPPDQDFTGAPSQAPGDERMWSPISSILNSGSQLGILADLLVTFHHVNALDERAKTFGQRITGVYITHRHQYRGRIVNERDGVDEIVSAALELPADRDNPGGLLHAARPAIAKRVSPVPLALTTGRYDSKPGAPRPTTVKPRIGPAP